MSKEILNLKCGICDKEFIRDDYNLFAYYKDEVFCRAHDGVDEWYNGLIKIHGQIIRKFQGEDNV